MHREYFGEIMSAPADIVIVDRNRLVLRRQHRDWTCSVACLRTILCTNMSEDYMIDMLGLQPGPHYSKDMKQTVNIFGHYQFDFGCDCDGDTQTRFAKLLTMLGIGWSVMIETIHNGGHWLILLGYYPVGTTIADCNLLLWDPYLGETRLENAEEVISMWSDGNSVNDYIAVKRIST